MTKRALLIGLLVVAAMSAVQPRNDFYYGNTYLQGNHFPIGAIFVLLLFVILVNPIIRLFTPQARLKSAELLTIWCLIVVGMSIPGSALLRYLYNAMGRLPLTVAQNPVYRGNVLEHLPEWLFPATDAQSDVIQGFVFGKRESVPWRAWLRPTLIWAAFFACMLWMMFCLTAIFRKQWVEYERLAFPLVHLPIEMCRTPEGGRAMPPIFSHRAFWIGLLIPLVVHGINGTHSLLHPRTPNPIPIPVLASLSPYVRHIPGAAPLGLSVYFSVVAVGLLLTLETTFSLWFFWLFFRIERLVGMARGVEISGYEPFTSNQQMGAYVVFMIALIWQARKHLGRVFSAGLRFKSTDQDRDELMSYRGAVWGLVGAVVGMTVWSTVAAGGGILWALVSAVLWIMVLTVVTRLVAQAGLLFIQCQFASPHLVPHNFGLTNLVQLRPYALSVMRGRILWDIREVMMPNAMNNMRISAAERFSPRRLFWPMVAALVVAFVCASFSQLKLAYATGTVSWGDKWATRMMPDHVAKEIVQAGRTSTTPPGAWLGLGLGAGTTAVLIGLRSVFFWWPLSPIGLLVAGTYPMHHMWFSIFLAWLLKWFIMHYGGGRTYRSTRRFALGLLLGDALMAGIWAIAGLIVGRGVYMLLPG